MAIEVGRRLGELLPDGGVFVDLSPLGDPGLIAQTIAGAVGVTHASAEGAGRDTTMDAVLAYLMHRRMLVVLDNWSTCSRAARKSWNACSRRVPT